MGNSRGHARDLNSLSECGRMMVSSESVVGNEACEEMEMFGCSLVLQMIQKCWEHSALQKMDSNPHHLGGLALGLPCTPT